MKRCLTIIFSGLMLFSCSTDHEQLTQSQFLPVKKIVNARDLGGYRTADGRTVRDSLLIRAASLHAATDADIRYLESLPVKKVIDFRLDEELPGREDRLIPGAEYVRIPINSIGGAVEGPDAEKIKKRKHFDLKKVIMIAAFHEEAQRLARNLYPNMVLLESCQKDFAAFLRMVVDAPEDGAIFFHCTQGKDRTGLASAYLLSALGVDRETIIADFDATNAIYAKDVKKLSRRVKFFGGGEDEVEVIKAFIGANTENFAHTLDIIDMQWGSMEAYLKGPLGLTDDDIETLRRRYLK